MSESCTGSTLSARSGVNESDGDGGATIVPADDHALVRAGLRMVLEEARYEIVAEAGDVAASLRKVRAYEPSMLVLDLASLGARA